MHRADGISAVGEGASCRDPARRTDPHGDRRERHGGELAREPDCGTRNKQTTRTLHEHFTIALEHRPVKWLGSITRNFDHYRVSAERRALGSRESHGCNQEVVHIDVAFTMNW